MTGFFRPSARNESRMARHMLLSGTGIVPAASSDPFFASVVLLLNMEGTPGSTAFVDLSTIAHTMTAAGNVQISTALGVNTAIFDGSGDRITTPYVKADFDWWTGDYTIEAWTYATNSVTYSAWGYNDSGDIPALIGCADPASGTNYWSFGPGLSGVEMYYYNGAQNRVTYPAGANPPVNAIGHIAMTKTASGIYLAVNGTVNSATAFSGTPQSSTSGVVLTIGQINNTSINGHIKAIRVTRAARYTANFTPPAAPFPTS